MKIYQHLGIWGSVALVSLTTQPVQSANSQIIEIKPEQREHSLELKLDTVGTQKTIPKIVTYNQGKTLVATLPNLRLGKNFTQKNPYPGISKIEINQGKNNNINVKVTGEKQAPTGSIFLQQKDDVILSFTPKQPQLLAQNITPNPDTEPTKSDQNTPATQNEVLIDNPKMSINGQPVVSSQGAPAFLPRAVAPPVGDIAVSNIDSSPITLDIGKNIPVRRLVLKDAPVREVLGLLARSAGVNLIFTDNAEVEKDYKEATISLDIDNEPIQEVFNSVLMVGGLQANMRGNTVFVGKNLPQQARNLVTRSFRLNQVKAIDAVGFLVEQGASTQRVVTSQVQTTEQDDVTGLRQTYTTTTTELKPIFADEESIIKSQAPLILRGVSVSADERLNTLTVIAEPRKMEIISAMIVQLDARRRQVAVNVKVVDVNLLNTEEFNSSLSFGVGDGFFVSDNGAAAFNYGGVNPPSSDQVSGNLLNGQPVVPNPLLNIAGQDGDIFFDPQNGPFSDVNVANGAGYARPGFGTNNNPFQPGIQEIDDTGKLTYALPSFFQYPSKFLALLEAKVSSGNGKILTDPTLVVQEGETAEIQLTQEVFGGFTKKQTVNPDGSSSIVDEPIIKNAGLILNIAVSRIDDNGFVSVNINPTISGISGSQSTAQGVITLTQERSSRSGVIRLRDGQTLILSGIIQEQDRTTVSKVPILGDIPLLGALFRSTSRSNTRNEVVVLVTPQIVDDSDQSGWGYNYAPGQGTRDALKKQGMTVPGGN